MTANSDQVTFMGASIYDLISYGPRFPKPGETLTGTMFKQCCGGKGANACVAAARLGLQNSLFFTKLGEDDFGKQMFNNYVDHGIRTDNVFKTTESHSSVSSIWVTEDGQNCLMYCPGAANLMTPADIESKKQSFDTCKLFVLTFECPPETILTALKLAKAAGVRTMVNAAPPIPGAHDKEIYRYCDVLIVNENEAEVLTGLAIKTVDDARESLPLLLNMGPATVIITLGDKGAIFALGSSTGAPNGGTTKQLTIELVSPTEVVNAIDTTGAGDAFMGALTYYMMRHSHLDFKEQVTRACNYATVSVGRRGTQSSYPYRAELGGHFFA